MEKLINDFKISFTKGDTYALAVKFKKIVEDLSCAYFTVKENPDDEPLIQKSLGAGIEKIDDREYKNEKTYKVQLQAIDTANLEAGVQYLYDLQVTIDDVVKTVLSGVFVVYHSVTGITSTTTQTLDVAVDDEVEMEFMTVPPTGGSARIGIDEEAVRQLIYTETEHLQPKEDETLFTDSKNIVGAINELENKTDDNSSKFMMWIMFEELFLKDFSTFVTYYDLILGGVIGGTNPFASLGMYTNFWDISEDFGFITYVQESYNLEPVIIGESAYMRITMILSYYKGEMKYKRYIIGEQTGEDEKGNPIGTLTTRDEAVSENILLDYATLQTMTAKEFIDVCRRGAEGASISIQFIGGELLGKKKLTRNVEQVYYSEPDTENPHGRGGLMISITFDGITYEKHMIECDGETITGTKIE